MPEAATNPHALEAAFAAARLHLPSALMLTGREARWPLRNGRVWPGVSALCAPLHPLYDLSGGPHAAKADGALRDLLDSRTWPSGLPRLIAANGVAAEGPAWDALNALAAEGRIDLHLLARWDRAMLERSASSDADAYFGRFLSAEQRKSLRRKRRRLSEAGALSFEVHQKPESVGAGFAVFRDLEAGGWKGRAGTALSQDAAGEAYVRDVLQAMAAAGNAFTAMLKAGSQPLAAGLFLRVDGEVLFWKTTYDERHARHSPGVVFDMMLTEWLFRQPWFERLDAGHDDSVDPATLIWRQRRAMAHVLIDLEPGSLRGRLARAGLALRTRLRGLKARYAAK